MSPFLLRISSQLADRFRRYACATDRVLEWLERAFEAHDPNVPCLGVTRSFDKLHGEPRFQNLLLRLHLPEEVITKYLSEK